MSKFSNNIITVLVCFALFFSMFTPMRALVKGGQAVSYFVPVVFILVFDQLIFRKQVLISLLVVFWILILRFWGVEYFENSLPECMTLLFGVLAFEHYSVTRDKSYATWVLITVFVTLFILIVISIPQFILQPNLTRMIYKAGEDSTIDFEYYWCISYRTAHELPVLSVPLFAIFHNTQKRVIKILALVCLVLMFVVIVYASSTTSLILMAAVYIIMFSYNKKKTITENLIKLGLITLLILPFMSKSFTIGVIDNYIQPVFEGSSISYKISDMRMFLLTGRSEGGIEAREEVHEETINSILSNPLLPEFDNNKIGQHSYLLDYLAAMGLFLFIPFIVLLYNGYKQTLKMIPHEKYYYTVSTLFFLLLATLKNFFVFIPAMFIVPLFLIQIENNYLKGYE